MKSRGFLFLLACVCLLVVGSVAQAQPYESFPLDTTRIVGPDAEWCLYVDAAFSDSVGLVVWHTHRRILARRVDFDGRALDEVCIDVSGPCKQGGYLGVASSGENFLAVWLESDGIPNSVKCALIDNDGVVLLREELATPGYVYDYPKVTYCGGSYFVSWDRHDSAWYASHFFRRVAPDGALLDSAPRRVCPNLTPSHYFGDWAAGEGECLVVLTNVESGYKLWGNIVRADGSLRDSVGFPLASPPLVRPWQARVAFNGVDYVVAWRERDNRVRAQRVSREGLLLDSAVTVAEGVDIHSGLGITAIAETMLVCWSETIDAVDSCWIFGRRYDRELRSLDPEPLRISTATYDPGGMSSYHAGYPNACPAGRDFLVAWRHAFLPAFYSASTDAACRRVTVGGQVLDSSETLLSITADAQYEYAVASDGRGFLAVWTSKGHISCSLPQIHGVCFSAAGPTSNPFTLGGQGAFRPEVAYGGGCYLVCWETPDRDVYASRVSPAGLVLDSVPIPVEVDSELASSRLDIGYMDSVFAVVWYCGVKAVGARITPAGVLLDTVPRILEFPDDNERNQQIASNGREFLVTRTRRNAGSFSAVRLDRNLDFLDTVALRFGDARSGSSVPLVAYGAGAYLVTDDRSVRSWLLSDDGSLLDTLPLGGSHVGRGPTLVFDGTNFLLVAREHAGIQTAYSPRVHGYRISPDGRVIDSIPLVLVYRPDSAIVMDPALAADGTGMLALVLGILEPRPWVTWRAHAAVFPAIVGLADHPAAPIPSRLSPTVIRAVLHMPETGMTNARYPMTLLDISGREVAKLHPGENDVRHLSPGVYFVRPAGTVPASGIPGDSPFRAKVILAR